MTEEQMRYGSSGGSVDPHTSMIMLAVLNRGLGVRRVGDVFIMYDGDDHRAGLFRLEQWDQVESAITLQLKGTEAGMRDSVLRLTCIFITFHCRWSGNHNGLVEIDPGRLERFILVYSTFLAQRWGVEEGIKFINEGSYPSKPPAAGSTVM